MLIEDDTLRLVSAAGLPARLRGETATLSTSLVGELMNSGKTVMMATGESGGFDDLIWSALPGLHTIALSLSHVAGRPYGALYALYSRRKLSHVDQGETGDRRSFGGVGIGLFIVRRLAEAQQGEVTASSRPEGGTSMRLRLRPAAE